MNCPSCSNEMTPDTFFCTWCDAFVPADEKGKKANIFARFIALVLDPMMGVMLYLLAIGIFGAVAQDLGVAMAILFPLGYAIGFLLLLRQGQTPGKKLLGLQVVHHQTGAIPGWGKMFVREIVGRFVSGLFLGFGYFWAIFDKNAQAWHDKVAGTVVIKRVAKSRQAAVSTSAEAASGIAAG